MAELVTIGVYGWSAEAFLGALRLADLRVLYDVRRRRGVRGSEYAWANSKRLQAGLAEAGIAYEHRIELAPTAELRQLVKADDARRGAGPRSRTELGEEFVERYRREILDAADLDALAADLPSEGAAALLCVEREPAACHRSLIAERLASEHGVAVRHLR